jgi:hypothetical protein
MGYRRKAGEDPAMKPMDSPLDELFGDERLCEKIRLKLPFLFDLAEQQASRGGRVGMEVGTLREQILIALLIYKFGEAKVDLDIPITEHEVDVRVLGHPLSIKTVTAQSQRTPDVKIVWTVDWNKVEEFVRTYEPKYEMLLVIVRWGNMGGFYGIPLQAQREIFEQLGKERYLRIPKPGTNPRGVDISSVAVEALLKHRSTKALTIAWSPPDNLTAEELRLAPYKRWLQYWQEEVQ